MGIIASAERGQLTTVVVMPQVRFSHNLEFSPEKILHRLLDDAPVGTQEHVVRMVELQVMYYLALEYTSKIMW